MSLFTESKVRARAKQATGMYKSAASVLAEKVEKQADVAGHDIFLSHAFDDRELLTGTVLLIEDLGYKVYIDWRDDPKFDRKQVTPATAAVLRERMRASRCLFYSVTPGAKESAWMKWELGWKDGHNGRTAILPIVSGSTEASNEQQFLGLYPYVSDGTVKGTDQQDLWIQRSPSCYVRFPIWLDGNEPSEHT